MINKPPPSWKTWALLLSASALHACASKAPLPALSPATVSWPHVQPLPSNARLPASRPPQCLPTCTEASEKAAQQSANMLTTYTFASPAAPLGLTTPPTPSMPGLKAKD